MKIITLKSPIALNLVRTHLPESDPARRFATETRTIYIADKPSTGNVDGKGMVHVTITGYIPEKSQNGTPYDLEALGGKQQIAFREALILAEGPA